MRYVLLATILTSGCYMPYGPVPETCPEPEEVHESVGPLIVEGKLRCTAWAINEDFLITAAHCIQHVWAFYHWKGHGVSTYAIHQRSDTALLRRIHGPPYTPLPFSPTKRKGVTLTGSGCAGLGYVQVKHVGRDDYTCTCFGDSGGPVMDAEGTVVGILTAHAPTREPGKTQAYYSPLEHIIKLLPE